MTHRARLGTAPSTKAVERLGMKSYTSAWALRLSWTLPSTASVGPPFPKPHPVPAHHCSKATRPPGAHRIRLRWIRRSHRIHCRIGACQTLLHRWAIKLRIKMKTRRTRMMMRLPVATRPSPRP